MYKMLATRQVAIITGRPRRFHRWEVIGVRVRSEIEATTMLAVEPIMVPLPPKPAPKTNAHHRGAVLTPARPSSWITGIKAMVIGTLSTTADRPAIDQIKITPSKIGLRWFNIKISDEI